MNALAMHALTILLTAAAPAPDNTLLKELIEQGIAMPDGQVICLPAPTMAEGLTAAQQKSVLEAVAPRGKVEEFLNKNMSLPISLRIGKIPGKKDGDVIRTINLHFVVYGDWDVLTSDSFSKTILKEGKAKNANNQGMVTKAGYLKALELAPRGLSTQSTPVLKEYFLYTTFELFQRVELSATRFCMATKMPDGVIMAAKVDLRFALPPATNEREFPNQWREIIKNALGNNQLGPPQPYSGGGFYAKVTRLIEPKNAIFVEFHDVFYEPRAWFGEDENLMPSELRKIVPFEVKQFRIKLSRAAEEAQKKQ